MVQKKKEKKTWQTNLFIFPPTPGFFFFVEDNLCHPPPRWLSNTLLHDGEECASAAWKVTLTQTFPSAAVSIEDAFERRASVSWLLTSTSANSFSRYSILRPKILSSITNSQFPGESKQSGRFTVRSVVNKPAQTHITDKKSPLCLEELWRRALDFYLSREINTPRKSLSWRMHEERVWEGVSSIIIDLLSRRIIWMGKSSERLGTRVDAVER